MFVKNKLYKFIPPYSICWLSEHKYIYKYTNNLYTNDLFILLNKTLLTLNSDGDHLYWYKIIFKNKIYYMDITQSYFESKFKLCQ